MSQPGSGKRILWFIGLWLAGVLAVGTMALIIKFWLGV